ncbi:MAG TPA: hypothetical protein VEC06_12055 [Paucimonas sp.]|nr:hypothetical protein [Paucimonas sp.]
MSRLPVTIGRRSLARHDIPEFHEMTAKKAAAPLAHAVTTHTLLHKHSARAFHNGVLTAALTTHLMDPQIWNESLQLQAAVMQRLQDQYRDWLKGCAILMDDYSQLRQANTMSKLVEKQCNLVTQWSQLVTVQATNLVGLMENIEVDYGYWVSQKLHS